MRRGNVGGGLFNVIDPIQLVRVVNTGQIDALTTPRDRFALIEQYANSHVLEIGDHCEWYRDYRPHHAALKTLSFLENPGVTHTRSHGRTCVVRRFNQVLPNILQLPMQPNYLSNLATNQKNAIIQVDGACISKR
jgi:hypothetical protein